MDEDEASRAGGREGWTEKKEDRRAREAEV